ncbi:MAG: hypothetical protein DME81_04945 [Verrucomicrobia bacterium]|nr:MAG: hypothetical protein DME81_04945 [Verrucomicrobiota bacterium]
MKAGHLDHAELQRRRSFRDPQIRNYGISSTRATCSLAADSRGIRSQRPLLAALEIAIRGTSILANFGK